MKNILFFTYLCCITLTVNAQDLISKIPKDAKVVVTLKGKNITDLVSTTEFENSKAGKLFLKEMRKDTDGKVSSLKDLGIDLHRNFYYFMTSDTIAFTHSFLVPLQDKEGFENLLSERDKKDIITEDNLSYLVTSRDNMVTMWNDKTLLVTIVQSKDNQYNDYSYDDNYEIYEVEDIVVETANTYPILTFAKEEHDFGNIIEGDVVTHTFNFTNTGNSDLVILSARGSCGCTVPSYPETPIAPGASGSINVKFNSAGKPNHQTKRVTITTNTENGTEYLKIKAHVHPKGTNVEDLPKVEEVEEEEIAIVEETVIATTEDNSYQKRRDERKAKQLERSKSLIAIAKTTMSGNYTGGSILQNTSYVKAIGNGKDEAVVWMDNIESLYTDLMFLNSGRYINNFFGLYNTQNLLYQDMSFTAKLNFENTRTVFNTQYTMNDDMATYTKAMYHGKTNPNFFKYFNEDTMLGYWGLNASTKGILDVYPNLMTRMYENSSQSEMATFMPIGMRLFSLLVDEKKAAEILRGDLLFVVTEMKEREISYTTYKYDDNYNRTAITKTKKETVPDFVMMATSHEKELFHQLMNAAVKESRGDVTLAANGLYQFNSRELPYTIYLMFKDNVLLIGSSPTDMMAIHNGTYTGNVSGKHKQMIRKNASVLYVNGKQIAAKFPKEIMSRSFRDKIEVIKAQTEDAIITVKKVKGNTMKGEMIINTPEKGHENSLAYFLNLINALVD